MASKKRKIKKNQPNLASILFVIVLIVFSSFMICSILDDVIQITEKTTNKSFQFSTIQKKHRLFIHKMAEPAIRVYRANRKVLPSIVIAQAIIESSWGNSQLFEEANNPFGMKGSYNGQTKLFPTSEIYNGKKVIINDYFRVYPNLHTAIIDHDTVVSKKFVSSKKTDYVAVARELQNNGYATDPNYADKIIHIIEVYRLTRFDTIK